MLLPFRRRFCQILTDLSKFCRVSTRKYLSQLDVTLVNIFHLFCLLYQVVSKRKSDSSETSETGELTNYVYPRNTVPPSFLVSTDSTFCFSETTGNVWLTYRTVYPQVERRTGKTKKSRQFHRGVHGYNDSVSRQFFYNRICLSLTHWLCRSTPWHELAHY